MIKLVTGSNQPYWGRIQTYLRSLEQHCNVEWHYIGVEWDSGNGLTLSAEENAGAPHETKCIQHGSFTKIIPARANTVMVYTDGDFVMQRPLDEDELALIGGLKHGQVLTSWNGGPSETLELEAGRLSPRITRDELLQWPHLDKPIYNIGFLAMTKKTWQQVHELYMAKWDAINRAFNHRARQQWLVCWAIHELGLDVKIAPWSLHAHGHFGLKPGMSRGENGLIYHDGKLAAFRHYL